jgi:ABC-type polysaccharide/polyol phosphate export permease
MLRCVTNRFDYAGAHGMVSVLADMENSDFAFFVALAVVAALNPGLIITALMVQYRDFRFIIPFIAVLTFISAVAYSSAVLVRSSVSKYFYSTRSIQWWE